MLLLSPESQSISFIREIIMHTLLKLLGCFTLTITLLSPAFATPISIDLLSPSTRLSPLNSTYAQTYKYQEADLSLIVTGWSYGVETKKVTSCQQYNLRGQCTKEKVTTTNSVKQAIEQDLVGKWDGLGVEKNDSPTHAVDNEGGDFDMHLLSFDQLVSLTSLSLGWYQNDTDISVLAFTGLDFEMSSLLGKKWEDLLDFGWSLVGNYSNVISNPLINPDKVIAQYWLVGTYNPIFGPLGESSLAKSKNNDQGSDYYKLRGITLEQPPVTEVSEPNIVLLLTFGLLGLGYARRRRA